MANRPSVAIRQPTGDPKNHTVVLRQLKESSETGSRQRGDPGDSYAKVSELVSTGSFQLVNNVLVAIPPKSTGWGVPTSAAAQNNYDGAAATLAQTSAAVAAIIQVLTARGLLGS